MAVEIDRAQFEHLCALQCPEEEMAAWFGCGPEALRRWCKRQYRRGPELGMDQLRARGKVRLREQALVLAEKNATMMNLLLKSYLGLTDRPGPEEGGDGSVVVYVPEMLPEQECLAEERTEKSE